MKKSTKERKNFVLILMLVLFLMTGCKQQVEKNLENDDLAETENSADSEMGFEKPQAYGVLMPEYLIKGLSVHGSANLTAGEQVIRAEIDLEDLLKLEEGYNAVVLNTAQDINLTGKLTMLPQDTADCEDGICYLEITLDEAAKVTTGVEVAIRLPVEDGVFYVNKECILKGEDGATYVWISLKEPQEIKPADWELREVILGETDGKRYEVLEGLNGDESLALMF